MWTVKKGAGNIKDYLYHVNVEVGINKGGCEKFKKSINEEGGFLFKINNQASSFIKEMRVLNGANSRTALWNTPPTNLLLPMY